MGVIPTFHTLFIPNDLTEIQLISTRAKKLIRPVLFFCRRCRRNTNPRRCVDSSPQSNGKAEKFSVLDTFLHGALPNAHARFSIMLALIEEKVKVKRNIIKITPFLIFSPPFLASDVPLRNLTWSLKIIEETITSKVVYTASANSSQLLVKLQLSIEAGSIRKMVPDILT